MVDDGRRALASAVRERRLARTMTKEAAARIAGISSITWKRVEDGQAVQDVKLAAIERTLEWPAGAARRLMAGGSVEEAGADDADQYVERSTGERGDEVDLTRIESDRLLAELARRLAAERDAQL